MKRLTFASLAVCLLASFSCSVWAGPADTKDLKQVTPPAPSEPLVYSQEFETDFSYSGRTTERQGM